MFELLASRPAAPPTSQSLLVNGLGGNGTLSKFTFTPGKKHLLRFVNTGINQFFHLALDGHTFTVIAVDFVPIKPYTTSTIVVSVGKSFSHFTGPRAVLTNSQVSDTT
jgi:FtsP/CotA-like multicopper oxidase with cupredoxin domain